MRQRRALLASLLGMGLALAGRLAANTVPAVVPHEVASELPGAQVRGSGLLRYLGLHIYDARLWSPAPIAGEGSGQALALELVYARKLDGGKIASRALDEMRRIGPFSDAQATAWLQAMSRLFPDVQAGDRLTGVQRPGNATRFYFNGQLRGEVADAGFAPLFFGIWLSARSAEPKLRAQLLGSTL